MGMRRDSAPGVAMIARALIPVTALAALAACAVQQNPAHTKVYTPVGVYDHHCPPGQAKKGNC